MLVVKNGIILFFQLFGVTFGEKMTFLGFILRGPCF
jgi:hypothetical protein